MTRINIGINPKFLTDEHLLAEHREIKRVCSRLIKRNGSLIGAPAVFTLGAGHELFFLRYGKFTYNRYMSIRNECLNRGFNVSDYSVNWKCYDEFPNLFNDYYPDLSDITKIIDRISCKILGSSKEFFHYSSKRITKSQAIDLIRSIIQTNE